MSNFERKLEIATQLNFLRDQLIELNKLLTTHPFGIIGANDIAMSVWPVLCVDRESWQEVEESCKTVIRVLACALNKKFETLKTELDSL